MKFNKQGKETINNGSSSQDPSVAKMILTKVGSFNIKYSTIQFLQWIWIITIIDIFFISRDVRSDYTKYLGLFLCIKIQQILLTSSNSRKSVIKDDIPLFSDRNGTRIQNQWNISWMRWWISNMITSLRVILPPFYLLLICKSLIKDIYWAPKLCRVKVL